MNCPVCRKKVPALSEWLPFCSERCKLIDLANWSTEKYVISTPLKAQEQAQPDPDEK